MIEASARSDTRLRERLARLSALGSDYWSFRGNSHRAHGHGLLQYPAMMVPQMARVVLREIAAVHPEIESVLDPFVGSGTILTEAMLRGLSFVGSDINPLAVLLCRTKAGPFYPQGLERAVARVQCAVRKDRGRTVEARFGGIGKWFSPSAQIALSRAVRAIRAEPSRVHRRFFWVALAETVRLTSNSRTSTFKLHVRTPEDIKRRKPDTLAVFERVIRRNAVQILSLSRELSDADLLSRGRYRGRIHTALASSTEGLPHSPLRCDALITSPPYGDNVSTVPYGQFSYLPLQWIDQADIDPGATLDALCTTHEIDSRSLGGRRRMTSQEIGEVADRSSALAGLLDHLSSEPRDRTTRVAAFFRDLSGAARAMMENLNPGALMVWVLGNRRVGGHQVPLDRILREILENEGAYWLATLSRRIHAKRMAPRNSIARTMSAERILVMRAGDQCGTRS